MIAEAVLGIIALLSLLAALLGSVALVGGKVTSFDAGLVCLAWLLFVVAFAASVALGRLRALQRAFDRLSQNDRPAS